MNALIRRWRNRRRLPLRVTLVAAMMALVTVALVVIGVAGTTLLQRYLINRVDNQLQSSATSARRLLGPGLGLGDTGETLGGLPGGGLYISYADASGDPPTSRLAWPANASRPAPPELPTITPAFVSSHSGDPFTVGSTSGRRHWRVLVIAQQDGSSLTVALGLDDVTNTLHRLIWIDTVVSIIVLAAVAGVGYFMVRGSLRRLREVERTAEAIAAGDLSQRVAAADDHTEVGRLGTSLNIMLGQIEDAFHARERSELAARASEERMRRFVADAGHELRTPLTSVRGFAELYRLGAVPDDAELARVMKRIEDEAGRMGLLVEDLLLLARLDQQRPLEYKPVDLLAIATDAVSDLHALHPERAVKLITDQDGGPQVVLGDEGRLRQVLGNLLTNAVTHTPEDTSIQVSLGTEGAYAVLAVSDNGPGMRPEDTARVFERFFRADPSRVRSSGGSGLGLSIVAALVKAHRGSVDVKSALGIGTTFTVRLPLAAIPQSAQQTAPPASPQSPPPAGPPAKPPGSRPSMPVGSHPGPPPGMSR